MKSFGLTILENLNQWVVTEMMIPDMLETLEGVAAIDLIVYKTAPSLIQMQGILKSD